jgi:anti-sigma B factor antagonist
MTITERIVGGTTILDAEGNLVGGSSADRLHDKVRSVLQDGRLNIILNLDGVGYMDSAGLGRLVQSYATARHQGGELKLLNLTKRLQDLLVITKLVQVFNCFDDEASAVASFTSAS